MFPSLHYCTCQGKRNNCISVMFCICDLRFSSNFLSLLTSCPLSTYQEIKQRICKCNFKWFNFNLASFSHPPPSLLLSVWLPSAVLNCFCWFGVRWHLIDQLCHHDYSDEEDERRGKGREVRHHSSSAVLLEVFVTTSKNTFILNSLLREEAAPQTIVSS